MFCAEVDRNGHPLTYQKGTWMGRKSNYIYGGLISVGCAPNALFCFAVGGGGGALSFSNYKWFYADPVGGGGLSISCPTVSFCTAVDYGGYALTRQADTGARRPRRSTPAVGASPRSRARRPRFAWPWTATAAPSRGRAAAGGRS